jgi:hypothetical protein
VSAKLGARLLAAGRVAYGVGLLVAPTRTAGGWLGRENLERPSVQAVVRSVGIRDVVLGMIALHTIDHPEVGPRWQATCAVVDSVDLLATVAARADLPAAGVAGTAVIAGGAAVGGFYFARALKQA